MLPIIVVVLVAAGDAADPATVALVQTAKRALDPGATVLALETSAPPTDETATSMARAQNADAIVVVGWEGERAHLRVRGERGDWSARDLDFRPTDEQAERGKTVGLIVATMIVASAPPPPVPPPPPPPARPERRWSVEIGPSLAVGLTSPSWSAGAGLALALRVVSVLWIDVAGQARAGRERLQPPYASGGDALWFVGGVGIAARFPVGAFWWGPRAELDVIGAQIARPGVSGVRVFGGVTAMLDAAWQPDHFGIRVGVGPETSFENTRISVDGMVVGHLPTSRLRVDMAAILAF